MLTTHSPRGQVIHSDSAVSAANSSPTSQLELLGYNTGYRFIERLAKDYPKFKDELDLLKFICKDFWVAVFRSACTHTEHTNINIKYIWFVFQEADRQSADESPGCVRAPGQ